MNLTEQMMSLASSHAEMVKVGMEHERSRFVSAITHLDHEYRKAQADQKCVMPTTLSLAVESLIGMIRLGESPYAERRASPRPDHDLTVTGASLKAGA